ncbi:trehalose-6-phosphate synthase [Paracidovorax avenae]|uniref:alpha,alpha-trehalose-phosphate synthase (UDP-forming) n=1 Tax=Paracidovorax avenae TaxID=80867 RepID=UPI000D221FAE|nr:trehalose-6-phosphate synthase [Paracidovorax avenae]AVS85554.1 trehalose-6-phosphate synthase [Paracidovorax avenae]
MVRHVSGARRSAAPPAFQVEGEARHAVSERPPPAGRALERSAIQPRRKRPFDGSGPTQPETRQRQRPPQNRLVVVSNRMVDPSRPAAGGLAVALADTMHDNPGLWMGWSGAIGGRPGTPSVHKQAFGQSTLVGMDLSRTQSRQYYAGYSNSVLWPVMHGSAGWADIRPGQYGVYRQVNRMFAAQLAPLLQQDDVLWIHDYHLIPLAQELRRLGCRQRMGFFNHIPFPEPGVFRAIPEHRELVESLFSYDLVGMQIPRDVENLQGYVHEERIGDAAADGSQLRAFGRQVQVRDFPIGIDVQGLMAQEPDTGAGGVLERMRTEKAEGRLLMVGVDRLDYSKGVPDRFAALGQLLEDRPDLHEKVTFVQIGAPSRPEVPAYAALARRTQKMVDGINRKYGTPSWTPILYFAEPVRRSALPEIYRMGRVGVVTSVADGMNLVAKEYVASQDKRDPGALVLSRGAGAAHQLQDAILVPPADRPAIAQAYEAALSMPLDERKERHSRLLDNVKTQDLAKWRTDYLSALHSVPQGSGQPDGEVAGRRSKRPRTMH